MNPPNLLFHGLATDAIRELPSKAQLELVYLDPPFGVGTTMTARTQTGQARGRKQPKSGPAAYEDSSNIDGLVAMVEATLTAVRERMARHATLYLHLDYRAVHEAKLAADRVFGRGAFVGEVIWAPGNGSRGARGFSVTHQTLLLYARSASDRRHLVYRAEDPRLREPYADTSLSMHFRHKDEDGRLFRERTIGKKTYRYYADAGRRLGSVWTDIPGMVANTPLRKEATGYPTQKPLRLLERIVAASSEPGALVADFMCGSGTTLVAAAQLGRRFVGGDRSDVAVRIAGTRLRDLDVEFEERVVVAREAGQVAAIEQAPRGRRARASTKTRTRR